MQEEITSEEEFYIAVCYDLHKMGVDPSLANKKSIARGWQDGVDVSTIACIEYERIRTLQGAYSDYD